MLFDILTLLSYEKRAYFEQNTALYYAFDSAIAIKELGIK